MRHVLLAVTFAVAVEQGNPSERVHDAGAFDGCATADALHTLLVGLARDEWRGITTAVATARWHDLEAIGYDGDTDLPVLYQRGVTETSGEPRCVERYSFAATGGPHRQAVLSEVEIVHRERDKETALRVAAVFIQAIVPTPRPGPSGRVVLDGHSRGTAIFEADYGWVRTANTNDAGARETVVLDIREEGGVFVERLSWTRDIQ